MKTVEPLPDDVRFGLEFSRHYDNLLWLVTSLFTTANAALLAGTFAGFHWHAGVAGVLLSTSTVFFAASFRALRRRVHRRIETRHQQQFNWLFSGTLGALNQWAIFILIFLAFDLLWIFRLATELPQFTIGWVALGSASFVAMLVLHEVSNRHTDTDEPGA